MGPTRGDEHAATGTPYDRPVARHVAAGGRLGMTPGAVSPAVAASVPSLIRQFLMNSS